MKYTIAFPAGLTAAVLLLCTGCAATQVRDRAYLQAIELRSPDTPTVLLHDFHESKAIAYDGDYRPGLQAVAELHVKSPLRHVELTKQEIRDLSKEIGLPTWDKQSFACLSSRFVYGEEITESKLSMVDQAEQLLLDMGFHQLRVRIHRQMARIEVMPSEFLKLMEDANREKIVSEFKKIGFSYVTLDLQGYRMGSMNETIKTD